MTDALNSYERVRLYKAETGELLYDNKGESGGVNENIKRDRQERLILQYEPKGVIRYYFYARDKGRPEQYILEYKIVGSDLSPSKRRKFISEAFPSAVSVVLNDLGYERDDSWESKVVDTLRNPEGIKKPDISDDARIATSLTSEFEVSVPDEDAALWMLFNETNLDKSVTISEGGHLDHRGQDDILIRIDSMSSKVEPINSTKEKVDKSVVKKMQKKSENLLSELVTDTGGSSDSISDVLNKAGIPDGLGIDIYSKSKSSKIQRRFSVVGFGVTVLALAVTGAVFAGGTVRSILQEPIVLGEPIMTVVGGAGPYIIRSQVVVGILGIGLLLSLTANYRKVTGSVDGISISSSNKGISRGVRQKANQLDDCLSEIRRRGNASKTERLLANNTPRDIAINEGSRENFRRKNAGIGVAKGSIVGGVLAAIVGLTAVFAYTAWTLVAQVLLIAAVVLTAYSIISGILSFVGSSASPVSDTGSDPPSRGPDLNEGGDVGGRLPDESGSSGVGRIVIYAIVLAFLVASGAMVLYALGLIQI